MKNLAVAEKGIQFYVAIAMVISVLLIGASYLTYSLLNGYYRTGAYGSLVIPSLILCLLGIWQIRGAMFGLFRSGPLIFYSDECFSYVSLGHSSVKIGDIDSFAIDRGPLRRLYLFAEAGQQEVKHYPLFLSSTSSEDVARMMLSLKLKELAIVG